MSDILYDAKLWLEGRPRHTRTHWQDCHLAHGHTECLVRKLLEEIELLKGYRDNAESDAAIAHLLVDRYRMTEEERQAVEYYVGTGGPDRVDETLRGLLDRTAATHATSAQASTPDGCTVQNDGSECKRRADYGKWLRTPYCEGHGCQCKEQKQAEK